MLEVKFYESAEDSLLKFAVIVSKCQGKWVFCKHKKRNTYECSGGHREKYEHIEDAAKRELWEETGAIDFHRVLRRMKLSECCVDVTWDDNDQEEPYAYFLIGGNTPDIFHSPRTFAETHIPLGYYCQWWDYTDIKVFPPALSSAGFDFESYIPSAADRWSGKSRFTVASAAASTHKPAISSAVTTSAPTNKETSETKSEESVFSSENEKTNPSTTKGSSTIATDFPQPDDKKASWIFIILTASVLFVVSGGIGYIFINKRKIRFL